MTCDETGAAFNPSRAQIFSSSSGERCAKVPTAPENLPNAQVFTGGLETRDVALRLGIPVCNLEAERDWFGVDAVRPTDHGCVFELPGAAFEHVREPIQIAGDQQ